MDQKLSELPRHVTPTPADELYCIDRETAMTKRLGIDQMIGLTVVAPHPPHAATHKAGGADALALDTLAPPTDTPALNATAAAHGLLPKLSGQAGDVLAGDGAWHPGVTIPTDAISLTEYVALGPNPAHTGAVRLGNVDAIQARDYGNTADVHLISLQGDQGVVGTFDSALQVMNVRASTTVTLQASSVSGVGGDAVNLNSHALFPVPDGSVDLGHPSGIRWRTAYVKTAVVVGDNPAQSGAVRLANGQQIMARNGANTGDLTVAFFNSSDQLSLGNSASAVLIPSFAVISNGLSLMGSLFVSEGAIQLSERASPGAPGANQVHLWLEDNGAGKSRLMAQFQSGAAIELAIEP